MLTLKETSLVPAGEWLGTVTSIKYVPPDKFGAQYELQLSLRRKSGAVADLRCWCSEKYTSGSKSSKLFLWTTALLGTAPRTFDPLTDLVGKTAIVTVTIEPKSNGDGEVNRVGSMRSIRPAAPAPVAVPVAPAPVSPLMSEEEWGGILEDEPAIDDNLFDDVAA